MDPITVLDQHLAKATASNHQPLIADITALKPLTGDRLHLLAEIDEQIRTIGEEQHDMAQFDTPRDTAFMAKFEALDRRYWGLCRLEKALKADSRDTATRTPLDLV